MVIFTERNAVNHFKRINWNTYNDIDMRNKIQSLKNQVAEIYTYKYAI